MTEKAEIVVDGNATGFRRAMQEAAQSAKDTASGIESAFNPLQKVFSGVQGKIAGITAGLAAVLAVSKESVAVAANHAEESIKLGRALGISATEASLLKEALDANNTSQDEFVGAAQKLSKQVRENEGDLNKMGLATRDSAGNLRPLNDLTMDAIRVLNGYKEGTDRAIAGQVLFGKGFELTTNLVNINKDSVAELAQVQRDLGAIVGSENVSAWQDYDNAGDKATLTLKAMKLAIGNALMPALTDMGNWFSSIGPSAVTVIKGAFGGLVATFHLVTTGVTVLWETINAMVVSVAEPIRALGASIGKALSGDWEGAAGELKNIGNVISGAWGQAFDQMASKAQSTRDRIWNLFAQQGDAAAPGGAGKSAGGLVKPDEKKKDKAAKDGPDSYMQYYEAALAEEKRLAFEKDAIRGYSKEQELAYWQMLIAHADLKEKDRVAITRKAASLIVEIKRDEAKQKKELDSEIARSGEELALGRLDAERASAQVALDLGQLTKMQFIAMEQQHEQQRFEIQRAAMVERLKLLEQDPNTNPVEFARIKNQILVLERQHQIKRIQLAGQAAQESGQIWKTLGDRMTGLWDKGVQALMNGTLTWRNAFKAIGTELTAWFAMEVVGKKIKSWLAGEALMLAQKLGFVATEKAIEVGSAATTVGIKSTEATAVVGANAAEAASGAAASVASIPYVGWAMAAGVFAATMAMVMGATSSIKSAAGGYDIPSGINPITQLHEEEMVLPKAQANVIRDMAEGGAGGGAGGPVHFHINTMDVAGVKSFLTKNAHAMAPGLRRLGRNFSPTGA